MTRTSDDLTDLMLRRTPSWAPSSSLACGYRALHPAALQVAAVLAAVKVTPAVAAMRPTIDRGVRAAAGAFRGSGRKMALQVEQKMGTGSDADPTRDDKEPAGRRGGFEFISTTEKSSSRASCNAHPLPLSPCAMCRCANQSHGMSRALKASLLIFAERHSVKLEHERTERLRAPRTGASRTVTAENPTDTSEAPATTTEPR